MEIKGKIKKISETIEISDRFRKREFIIEYSNNPEYPQFIQFEMVQDRCEFLDQFKEGQQVEIFFDLRGREWTSPQGEIKYFNTLQAWKIISDEVKEETSSKIKNSENNAKLDDQEKPGWLDDENMDDLPF
tara:strand:- start:866 stop:1258 length:393 start_codon:yes stop_codon:yes gene_type:complete